MKKNIFLLSLILLSFTTFSQVSSEELGKDKYFAEYVTTMDQMAQSLITKFTREEIKALGNLIETKKKENLSVEEQNQFVSKIFRLKDPVEFSTFQEVISKDRKYLKDKYGVIDKDVFENAGAAVLQSVSGRAASCGWRYGICAASVGFQGALMLSGCEAGTLGIGTPLCVAGVSIWTANALGECYDDYCK